MLDAAVNSGAELVSITSFNEWGEGTQIEPARDYGPGGPEMYLDLTKRAKAAMANRAKAPDL